MRSAVWLLLGALFVSTPAGAQVAQPVLERVRAERAPLIETLRDLVAIESGSRDPEGLARIADLIADRLAALGGEVERVPVPEVYRMADTPPAIGDMVLARFRGSGRGRILLLAHMDTVYQRGMLTDQPFRIEGDRAYGLGIADDKHGVAVILHTLSALDALDFRDYALITVLINADEEVSSPGSRTVITRLGREHDVVFSCEGAGANDRLSLTTAGIASIKLTVGGRASHAGAAPEQGRNALYELAHQILQTRNLSDPSVGVKLNWTVASGGSTRNVIPAHAEALADVRVLRVEDYDRIERAVRERIGSQLISDTTVEMIFERRRPPLETNEASRSLARHARGVYEAFGRELTISEQASGGGTDAAFASLETDAPVIEGFGLRGFGAHSDSAEYVDLTSIEPRLYLLTRMIMDVAEGRAPVR